MKWIHRDYICIVLLVLFLAVFAMLYGCNHVSGSGTEIYYEKQCAEQSDSLNSCGKFYF